MRLDKDIITEVSMIRLIQQKRPKQKSLIIFPKEYFIKENCDICGDNQNLLRHHITYQPVKLITVCGFCHSLIHNTRHFEKYKKLRERFRNCMPGTFRLPDPDSKVLIMFEETIDTVLLLKELDKLTIHEVT